MQQAEPPIQVTCVDTNPYQLERAAAPRRHLIPSAKHPEYLDVLERLVAETGADIVWPNHEAEIALIARERPRLGGAVTFLPDYAAVEHCQDKMTSYEYLRNAGLPVPESIMVNTEDDLREAFNRFGSPIWVRALRGTGGKGARPVDDMRSARLWIELNDGWGSFMAAECLSASTITWESVWRDGELIFGQGRKRLYWEFASLTPSGVTGIAGGLEWVADSNIDDIGMRSVNALSERPNGIFGVDITYDNSGAPRVTEINCGRFMSGGIVHHLGCGTNVAQVVARLALGESPGFDTPLLNPCRDGVLVHGMDVEPVTTTVERARQYKEELAGRLTSSNRVTAS